MALAAVVVCLLAVSAFYLPRHSSHLSPTVVARPVAPPVPAEVAAVRGEVYLVNPSGQVSLTGSESLDGGGTIKTVGSDSRATLALTDGTKVELMGNTSFIAGPASGKRRLFLKAGAFRSTVVKQPEGMPLVFDTAEATATVRGTDFALIEDTSGPYLVVLQGAVTLRRSSDGLEILINAGYYGHAEWIGEIHPWPIALLPRAQQDQIDVQY